ncbi:MULTISPECIES: DNA recombination protein RmuC [Arsenicicoccus]|uniref:DNA recombination protein RmuC n=1 Tax=Arsenicicoccus TaxID=267408 RepID=UPI00257CB52D|nr:MULTISPECIES: DNA recombination protein RmuC [Arsenicicoccus]
MDVNLVIGLLVGIALGTLVTWLALRGSGVADRTALAGVTAERDLLRERCLDLETTVAEDSQTSATLGPMREALSRMERTVGTLERDRQQQYGALGSRLEEVSATTAALREQTASLAGSLQSSSVRGAWGEAQLRRLLEHAGLLARCDFDEQVSAVSEHDAAVRPDAVVRLPGGKVLVIDAKAPLTRFLAAQAEGLDETQRAAHLRAHAGALRGHVDTLAAKAYWTAFPTTPEMVVCFVPSDAVLAAGLAHDPTLYDDALARHVVLASPATLLALLRTVAFTWQQDALATNAAQLLALGKELYSRIGTLAGHTTRLGAQLSRSVEAYNAMVGTLESRVLVTARRMHELELVSTAPPTVDVVETAARPLTSAELLDALDEDVHRPELDLAPPRRATLPRRDETA